MKNQNNLIYRIIVIIAVIALCIMLWPACSVSQDGKWQKGTWVQYQDAQKSDSLWEEGHAYYEWDNYDEAIKCFKLSLQYEYDQESIDVTKACIAAALLEIGDPIQAEMWLDEIINPIEDPGWNKVIASIYQKLDRMDKSMYYLKQARVYE